MVETQRLQDHYSKTKAWLQFGPYVSNRQWGTVREDYSPYGTSWDFLTHDMARSTAYRWGEEGIGGISDDKQILCFALALWNQKDPIIKERLFGLNNSEGNHGEDVKELYYYLDSSPTHSYMKMLYKYPQGEFPYTELLNVNKLRGATEPEFELIDTGLFDNNEYFDVFIEYAKADADDILIKISVFNRADKAARIHVIPTFWFRNNWSWNHETPKPNFSKIDSNKISVDHPQFVNWEVHLESDDELVFCDNETNFERLYNSKNAHAFVKDGINEYLVHNNTAAVNNLNGTKFGVNCDITIPAYESRVFKLRLENKKNKKPFADFDQVFEARQADTNNFYNHLQKDIESTELRMIQRQAYAGMLWSKQFYYYDIKQWLKGDDAFSPPPPERLNGRNKDWIHLNNDDIISMPDKWEYPWYAAWDLAFHSISLASLDLQFAKNQLILLMKEWYMHPNGQLPAYEWAFGDVNPPVHAWAAWEIFSMEKKNTGYADIRFLEATHHKLVINFTWWVNRKDVEGRNIFQGGFLGLDNIEVFDRSAPLPTGGFIEQADGTSWMAMYALNLMRISLELSLYNTVYETMATKFFEHFMYIAAAMTNLGGKEDGLWDKTDEFFYDVLRLPDSENLTIKIRSIVGLIPLFAVEVLEEEILTKFPDFKHRVEWFYENNPSIACLVSRWTDKKNGETHLLSLLRGHRMKKLLYRLLDENEFLAKNGIRALSKYHDEHPYVLTWGGKTYTVAYTPGESTQRLFGGNSNWRGPIWMPVNYLIISSIKRFYDYYGPDFKVEYPTHSGEYFNLLEIANALSKRLVSLFEKSPDGTRPFNGENQKLQTDEHFKDYILFYEYFHGDSGRGVGANHQTGWTGLVTNLIK